MLSSGMRSPGKSCDVKKCFGSILNYKTKVEEEELRLNMLAKA